MTTNEQMTGREQFRKAVVPALGERVRVVADAEGWPMVPGRQGRLEWRGVEEEDGTARVYVYTPKRRMISRLSAVPGVHRGQIGDDEAAFWVAAEDAEAIRAVARLIGPRVRRASVASPKSLAALAAARAQRHAREEVS